jgi:hypothetical protein
MYIKGTSSNTFSSVEKRPEKPLLLQVKIYSKSRKY